MPDPSQSDRRRHTLTVDAVPVEVAPVASTGAVNTCSVSQVDDREWWCSIHRRNAEDCAEVDA